MTHPGRSEMSFGKGEFAHPLSDYQSQRTLPWSVSEDSRDLLFKYALEKRTDPTNSDEVVEDMIYEYGNPDQFGPAPLLVQESQISPPAVYKQPVYRFGVDRQK